MWKHPEEPASWSTVPPCQRWAQGVSPNQHIPNERIKLLSLSKLVYFKYRRGFRHRSYWQFSHTPHTNFPQLSTTGSTVWNLAWTPHTYPPLNFCQKSIVIGVLQITAATRLPHWHWNHCLSHKVLLQLSRAGPLPWSTRGIYATPMPIFSLREANEKSPIRNTPCALMIARTLHLEVTCDLGETSTRCFLLPFATQQKKLHPVRKHFSSPWASTTLRNQVIKQQHLVGASSQKKKIVQGDPDLHQHNLARCNAPSYVCPLPLPEQNQE